MRLSCSSECQHLIHNLLYFFLSSDHILYTCETHDHTVRFFNRSVFSLGVVVCIEKTDCFCDKALFEEALDGALELLWVVLDYAFDSHGGGEIG